MFVNFDYRCPECGATEERFVRKSDMDNQFCYKDHGFGEVVKMIRLPAGTRTDFKFADSRLKR